MGSTPFTQTRVVQLKGALVPHGNELLYDTNEFELRTNFRGKKEKGIRRQQDSNLRPQRGTDF